MAFLLDRRGFLSVAAGAAVSLVLAGCGAGTKQEGVSASSSATEYSKDQVSAANGTDVTPRKVEGSSSEVERSADSSAEEGNLMRVSVRVNGTAFTATLDNGPAGQDFASRLPLTLSMEELHGNEKYNYTGLSFGGSASVPSTIEAGDLMVFGSDCLVLFYQTFANDGWSYKRVGKIDDPSGLADACGSGTATVEFALLD